MCVCVCVCVRERECVSVSVFVSVYVCIRKGGWGGAGGVQAQESQLSPMQTVSAKPVHTHKGSVLAVHIQPNKRSNSPNTKHPDLSPLALMQTVL